MAKKPTEQGTAFLRWFGPMLDALRALGGSGTPDEVVERIAHDCNVPDAVQNEVMPSGELRYRNQVHWARFYLARDGLLDRSKRGVWSLTDKGRTATVSEAQARDIFLRWVRIDQEARKKKAEGAEPPAEQIDAPGSESVSTDENDVIALMLTLPPSGFERLAQRLLREAGFVQVEVTGRSNDGGIDGNGTLKLNALVSFKVLFQCKRYAKAVVPSQVRDFRGAMAGRADKGIIITTGTFTAEARREASRDGVPPIELVDGEKLVEMLQSLELGLKPITTFAIDRAFFDAFRS